MIESLIAIALITAAIAFIGLVWMFYLVLRDQSSPSHPRKSQPQSSSSEGWVIWIWVIVGVLIVAALLPRLTANPAFPKFLSDTLFQLSWILLPLGAALWDLQREERSQQQNESTSHSQPPQPIRRQSVGTTYSKPTPSNVPRDIQETLLRMVNFDQALATRLIERTRANHPGRSEQWVWEKVIWDLERDRH